MYHLIVRAEFGPYKRGDRITDEAQIAAILATEQCHHVVKVLAPPTLN